MKYVCLLAFVLLSTIVWAQQHPNDECSTASVLSNIRNYCSADAQFTTVNATESGLPAPSNWPAVGKDIWLKFTAVAYDINITVSGNVTGGGSTGGTLQSPLVALYSTPDCQNFSTLIGNMSSTNNAATFYKGGLTIGGEYYIRISGSNTGTFKLCVNNYNPILKPGQDCSTAAFLCSRASFTELNVTGAGINNHESVNTCLGTESNTAWYKWTAANNGTLAFTITPTVSNDDIDWILYDLGITGNCGNVTAANAIRCAAGHGVDNSGCKNEPLYHKTGLNMTETDLSEAGGCGANQNGFVKYIDMQQGHVYALLVDNFSSTNNGFTIDFSGTGEFLGPESKFSLNINQPCTSGQNYVFTNQSTTYSSLRWTFGSGASLSSSTTPGPHTITYSTSGVKTVVLEAINDKGCFTVATETFAVATTPGKPVVSVNKPDFCLKDTIRLLTDSIPGLTYEWKGPNNFISRNANLNLPIRSETDAGIYILRVFDNNCVSEPTSITIPPIKKSPVAAFHTIPSLPAKLSHPVTVTFFNDSKEADIFLWDFGDGTRTFEINPTHTYTSAGDYNVTLIAFKSDICNSSIKKGTFVIKDNGALFIPNTFTPNGDGINDEFVVTVTNLVSYNIKIFNRWGMPLFESPDIFDNWKGSYKGEPLPVGTYYYVLDAVDLNGASIKKSGSISVIR